MMLRAHMGVDLVAVPKFQNGMTSRGRVLIQRWSMTSIHVHGCNGLGQHGSKLHHQTPGLLRFALFIINPTLIAFVILGWLDKVMDTPIPIRIE